jgi:hypothetical protein
MKYEKDTPITERFETFDKNGEAYTSVSVFSDALPLVQSHLAKAEAWEKLKEFIALLSPQVVESFQTAREANLVRSAYQYILRQMSELEAEGTREPHS